MALSISSPASRLLLAFLLSFLLFTLYGRFHFYRDPGSVFYDQSRAYERKYSLLRQTEVEQARNAVKADGPGGLGALASRPIQKQTPELCVSMTTVKRDGLERQYVEDAILSMLDGITQQERSSIHLNLLFTDFNPADHPSWHQPWIRPLIDDIWSYESHKTSLSPGMHSWLRNMTLSSQLRTKASMDYTFALQRCLDETTAPYIAVIEGDVLMTPGWVAPTLHALRLAEQLMRRTAKTWYGKARHPRGWIDVRLFNQERSTGWSSRRIGGNNELKIILAVDAIVASAILLFRRKHSSLQRHLDNSSLLILTLLIIPVSIITFFQAGKASLLPPSPGLVIENFGCCSQALIFNRVHVAGLIDYLRSFALEEALGTIEHEGYDMRCRDYARDAGLDRLALYPVQAQHMGIHSATGTTNDEAQSVWSMAYEDLQPAELKARHERAMEYLYGPDWKVQNEGVA